jgi:hypothetical protein
MKRELIVKWNEAHEQIRQAADLGNWTLEHFEEADRECKGWTYFKFLPENTRTSDVVYEMQALKSEIPKGFLPLMLLNQHNRVVVGAWNEEGNNALNMLGLYRILKEFEKNHSDAEREKSLNFYGKLGGLLDPANGRILALYSKLRSDTLELDELVRWVIDDLKLPKVQFQSKIINGLTQETISPATLRDNGNGFAKMTKDRYLQMAIEQAEKDFKTYISL